MAVGYGMTQLGRYKDPMTGRVTPGQTGFDFSQYGENPYTNWNTQMGNWLGEVGNPFKLMAPTQDAQGQWSFGGMHVARPGDPEVQDYMGHIMGGQRQSLQDAVSRMAGAGINRNARGMGLAGTPSAESAMTGQAMQTLAGGYSDRFKQAMDYNKYAKDYETNLMNQYQKNLMQGLGLQLQGLGKGGDWQTGLADRMREAYNADIGFDRGATQRAQQQMKWNQQQDAYVRSLEDPVDRMARQAQRFTGLAANMAWPATNMFNELGVTGLGIASPWSRSASVGGGGGGKGGSGGGAQDLNAGTMGPQPTTGSWYDPFSNRTSYFPTYS